MAHARLAFASWARASCREATETYQKLATMDAGASFAASGLGDLALYEGPFLGRRARCSRRAPPRIWRPSTATEAPR